MKNIIYSDQAMKFLNKIAKSDALRIQSKIKQLAVNADELKNQIKKLTNSIYYRLRVSDYRVIYTDDGKIIKIEKVGNRGDVYRGV